ncbi:hypothetical protein ACTXT7_003412 [Hymenolepis weldensis]
MQVSLSNPSSFLCRSFTSFSLRFNGISVRLNHEALQGGSIAQKSCASADFALNSTGPTTTLSTSVCKWDQIFDLIPDEHLKVVVFTLDPSTLGSAVQVEAIELGLTYANRIFHLRWFPSVALSTSENHPLPVVACNYTARLEEIKYHIADGSAKSPSSSSTVDEEDVILNSNLTPLWEFFNNQLSAVLLPKASNLEMSLRHTPPVLCNEKYVILCQILNTEAGDISDLTISAMLAGGGVNDATLELTPTSLDVPQRLGSVAVGQMAGQNLNPTSSSGDELFSQAFIASNISQGVDFVCPIFVHCPKVAGDRSLRVDAHYNMLTHFPTPGVKVFSWTSNGSISLVSSENDTEASSAPTLTRCVQSKRVQLSVTPPFEITSRLLSLNHEAITTVVTGKSFILEVSLTNCSPWPISVESSLFNLAKVSGWRKAYLEGVLIQKYARGERESEEALELNINNKLEMALASFQTLLLLANHGLNEVMRTFYADFAKLQTLLIFVADDEIVQLLVFLKIRFAKPDELTVQASESELCSLQ